MPSLAMKWLFPSLLLLLTLQGLAAPRPAAPFADGAVLQQGKLVPVWGSAEPGERITVAFRDQRVSTTADASGGWQVLLTALEPSAEEAELSIQGTTTVTLRRILVGEVWLCAGQSNMQWPVEHCDNAAAEISAARFPLLRHAQFLPVTDTGGGTAQSLAWQEASPANAAKFSAVAYFFGRNLHRKTGIPIGVIQVSVPGSPIEGWLSHAALSAPPGLPFVIARWQEDQAAFPARQQAYQTSLAEWQKGEKKAREAGPAKHSAYLQKRRQPREPQLHAPSSYFNSLIAPLLPFAVRGVVWYQGEANAARPSQYGHYEQTLRAFIHSLRGHFADPALPFLQVQLGAYSNPNDPREQNWAVLRQAQAAVLDIPNTGLVVSLDLDVTKTVHPTNKQEIARRLSQTALATIYQQDTEYLGPTVRSAQVVQGRVRIDFDHAATGLIAYRKPVQSLEVAGADGRFFPATATIQGNALLLSCPSVPIPKAVRYAWSNAPYANLANGSGFPAAPFQLTELASTADGATPAPLSASGPADSK